MSTTRVRVFAGLIVAIPLVLYPAVILAGGSPRFPSADDCVRVAPVGTTERVDLVFGRRDSAAAANVLLRQVQHVGYVDAVVELDACGRWKVLYNRIENYQQGASSAAEARGAGLDAQLELAPP